ncbi:MAG: MBL fold metallo-hydrolase, partial [Candidatus Zixiibacteriota bacterium]
DFSNVQINGVKVTDNIYMLEGQGGNIGLSFGKQGIFIIDDQFAPLHEKIVAKVIEITAGHVPENSNMFVINTHFHGDHTGGNELMGKTGAIIIAHENVRKRLSTEQINKFFNRTTPPSPEGALPIITFTNDLTFHLNGDSVNVHHVAPAHTDGDAIIHFTKANVIHSGDILFTTSYPVIDLDGGGSVAGMILAVEEIMNLCNEATQIIPGHGKISDKAGLARYHEMLETTFKRVSNMVEEGKTLEQIFAAKPTAEFDREYSGFVTPDRFVGVLFRGATTPN